MSTITDLPLDCVWRPSVDDVAALLRARTKDASGRELGTFTADTRPTDAEVERLISFAVSKIAARVGWTLPDEATYEATHLAAVVTACEVELSYWPEQVRSDRSAYPMLYQFYQDNIEAFVTFVSSMSPPGSKGAGVGTFYVGSGTVYDAYNLGWFGTATVRDVVGNLGRY